MTASPVSSTATSVLPLEIERDYEVLVGGKGALVRDASGREYLDAMSGGSMAATLGHGRSDLLEAARNQARQLSYVNNELLTNPAAEKLAVELTAVAPEGFARARFVTGGSEANELAVRMARAYHVARGEPERWQIISPAQAYHGPTMQTLALTGRPGLQGAFRPYMPEHLHIPPSTHRFDESGQGALDALDAALDQAGPDTVSLYFCEPISAAALPAYSPPALFWEGLSERRERHGFLVGFDEVVTGVGRIGDWFAANRLPIVPDIIATAKGLGAGYAALAATLCRDHVYRAIAASSTSFSLGHTWDGAPISCAVGLAVIDILRSEKLIDRVAVRGPSLRDELERALDELELVREVRGHGYLLGVEYVDPRDGRSLLPRELGVAGRVDAAAERNGLLVLSTQPTADGFAGDQSLFAPPFVTTEEEIAEMVDRFAMSVAEVAAEVEAQIGSHLEGGGS